MYCILASLRQDTRIQKHQQQYRVTAGIQSLVLYTSEYFSSESHGAAAATVAGALSVA